MNKGIQFIKYNEIEGYIELMKRDVEPLNNPECTKIDLLYDGQDIKAVLDYITNLQDRINKAIEKLNTQLAFTSNYQLNYQSAMYLIEETKDILKGNNEEDERKCEICGVSNETVQYREDPFVKELDNISQDKYMCDKCYENSLYDI